MPVDYGETYYTALDEELKNHRCFKNTARWVIFQTFDEMLISKGKRFLQDGPK